MISTLLSFSALAHAQANDNAPTADDWEDWNPERCAPDPGDNLKLTPLIFPPQYSTTTEIMTGPDVREFVVKKRIDKKGKSTGPWLIERAIPNVSNPTRRRESWQYVAFLNGSSELVDELGQLISEDNPIDFPNTNLIAKHSGPYNQTLWERFDEPPAYKSPSALASYEGQCEYYLKQVVFRQVTWRTRSTLNVTSFNCKDDGGYQMSPPEISEKLIRKPVVYLPNTITFWDHEGERFSGPSYELVDQFNKLAETGKCEWTKAGID